MPFCGFGPGRNPAIRGGGFFFVTQPGSAGEPPLVRLRTDTFLRREKCPRCRVRGWCPRADAKRAGCGNFLARSHSPQQTRKERQAPVHCPSPTGCGEARSSARSAHRNGHFPSSWKMSETPRAVQRDRAQRVHVFRPARRANGPGRGILFRPGAGEAVSLSAAARCDPDTLPWRPKCSSQAHYAAAAPRLVRPAPGGGPSKTGGERRPAFLSPPARRPGPLHGHL